MLKYCTENDSLQYQENKTVNIKNTLSIYSHLSLNFPTYLSLYPNLNFTCISFSWYNITPGVAKKVISSSIHNTKSEFLHDFCEIFFLLFWPSMSIAAVSFVSLLLIFDDILQDNLIEVMNATILYNVHIFWKWILTLYVYNGYYKFY